MSESITKVPKKKRQYKRRKTKHKEEFVSQHCDVCINDVLPMDDILFLLVEFLQPLDIVNLKLTCHYYNDLLTENVFKKFVSLDEDDLKILKFALDKIPYNKMAISYQTGRCVECNKRNYTHLYDHLPTFYVCYECVRNTDWLRNVCKSRMQSEFFLTPTQLKKHKIQLRSFYVTNPHYKNASDMELFWELEARYYAYSIYGGKEGYEAESEKRKERREKRAKRQPKIKESNRFYYNRYDRDWW